MNEDDQTCTCGDGLADVTAALRGEEVGPCELHRPARTDTPALGSDALLQLLASKTGARIDTSPGDLPPAA